MTKNAVSEDKSADPMAGLTAKQKAVLPILLSGATSIDAGRVAAVNPKTISNWRKNSRLFRDAESSLRAMAIERAQDDLLSLSEKAVAAISASLGSWNEAVRLSAAKHVCDRLGLFEPPEGSGKTNHTGAVDMDALFKALGVSRGAIE